jgi:hypothetical protein
MVVIPKNHLASSYLWFQLTLSKPQSPHHDLYYFKLNLKFPLLSNELEKYTLVF